MTREASNTASHKPGRFLVVVAAVLVLCPVLVYQVVLAQLDRPYVKRALNAILPLPQGVTVDYQRLDLAPLAGRLHLAGLTVTAPDAHRPHTPLLLELDRLSVRWAPRSLLTRAILVEAIEIGQLRLYEVVQEGGPSTWDLFGNHDQPEPASHEPLSTVARLDWFPLSLAIRSGSVAGLGWTRTELDAEGALLRRLECDGLGLTAEGRLAPGDVTATVTLRSRVEPAPARLRIHDGRYGTSTAAELQAAVTVMLSASRSATFSVVADLVAQTIDPSFAWRGRVVDVQGAIEFAPERATTRLAVTRLDLLQGTLSAEFTAELEDHSVVPKLLGSGHARLDPLLKLTAGFFPGWDGRDLEVHGRFTTDPDRERAIRIQMAGRAGEVRWRRPDGSSLAVEQGSLDLRGRLDPDHGAEFLLSAPAKQVTYRSRDGQVVSVANLTIGLDGHEWSLDGQRPSSASGTIRSEAVHIGPAQGPLQRAAQHTRFHWELSDFEPVDAPVPVSGRVTLTGFVDDLDLAVTAWAKKDDAGTDLTVKIGRLGALARWLPDMGSYGIRLDRVGVEASLSGRYRNLGRGDELDLDHTAAVTVSRVAMRRPGVSVESPTITVHAEHHGRGATHDLTVEFDPGETRVNGRTIAPTPRLTADAHYTEEAISARIDAGMKPAVALSFQGRFDRRSGVLTHRGRLAVDRAPPLSAWLPKWVQEQYPIDWSRVTASLEQQGRITGLLVMRADRAVPELTGRPLHSLAAEQAITLDLHRVTVDTGTLRMDLPDWTLHATGSQRSGRIMGSADVHTPHLTVVHNGERFTVHALTQHADFDADSNPAEGDVELRMTWALQRVRQDALPFYPISDVTLSGRAHLSRLETFVLDGVTLHNKGGGTHITLSKSLNRAGTATPSGPSGSSLRELTLTGRLTQSLEALSRPEGGVRGRGVVTAPLTVYSSDGTLFNVSASVELDEVSLDVPEAGLSVEGLSGRVGLDETFEWDADDGLSVVHDSERNHFSTTRYQDAQPFLANQSAFKIERLRWQERTMGPIVGSLHVKNNVFALNKLKVQKEQGTISGQVIVEYAPGAEQVRFRGNVTGVRIGKSRQRLDGNVAVTFVPARLELDGRVQILRLTRQHLEDILDLLDPFREDPGLNRLRFALAFGYPRFVRMEVSQGLAALKVDLGGIGELLTIDEIRGIALGPFMTRHVEPLLNPLRMAFRDRRAS